MGLDLFETIPESRIVFETANDVLGFSLTDYCFGNGDEDEARAHKELTHTAICQPALYTHTPSLSWQP